MQRISMDMLSQEFWNFMMYWYKQWFFNIFLWGGLFTECDISYASKFVYTTGNMHLISNILPILS